MHSLSMSSITTRCRTDHPHCQARGSPQNPAALPTLQVSATQSGHSEWNLADPCALAHPPHALGRRTFHPEHIPQALRHTPAPEGKQT